MLRNLRPTVALAVVLGASAAACQTVAPNQAIPPIPTPSVNQVLADVISPGLDHNFVFGKSQPPVGQQPGSEQLMRKVHKAQGLFVAALLSTKDSAAILLVEDNPKVKIWGTLLRPAQRTVFQQFAAHPQLGDWLIMLDDVVVHGTKDPIPLTAYRWARADVERYVACGIPRSGQNLCSKTFYLRAVTVILQKSGAHRQG